MAGRVAIARLTILLASVAVRAATADGETGVTTDDHETTISDPAPASTSGRTVRATASGSELPPTVYADGTGLPPGSGTARAGAALYAERCASCHGSEGEGARAVELVGDPALITSAYPDRGIAVHWPYAPPLYDYVRRAMPPDAPWSLGAAETYAVVARVLELNGLVDADTPVDAAFLGALVMPNVHGFESAPD